MINGRSGPIYASSLSLCFWNLAFTSSAQIIRSNQDHRPKQFSQNKYRLWKFCGGEGGWSAAAAGSWGGREERHPASNPQASLVILSNNSHFLFPWVIQVTKYKPKIASDVYMILKHSKNCRKCRYRANSVLYKLAWLTELRMCIVLIACIVYNVWIAWLIQIVYIVQRSI